MACEGLALEALPPLPLAHVVGLDSPTRPWCFECWVELSSPCCYIALPVFPSNAAFSHPGSLHRSSQRWRDRSGAPVRSGSAVQLPGRRCRPPDRDALPPVLPRTTWGNPKAMMLLPLARLFVEAAWRCPDALGRRDWHAPRPGLSRRGGMMLDGRLSPWRSRAGSCRACLSGVARLCNSGLVPPLGSNARHLRWAGPRCDRRIDE
jgi:hypothetical protein